MYVKFNISLPLAHREHKHDDIMQMKTHMSKYVLTVVY
jgi:hypothetical protein